VSHSAWPVSGNPSCVQLQQATKESLCHEDPSSTHASPPHVHGQPQVAAIDATGDGCVLPAQVASAAPERCKPPGQVALEKTQGNLGAAVEALRKYVDIFQTDCEAWEELGALYLQARARALVPLARRCRSHSRMSGPMRSRALCPALCQRVRWYA
jgi:hypothetical protein